MSGISGWSGYRADDGDNEQLMRGIAGQLTRFDGGELQIVTGEHSALCVGGTRNSQADCCRRSGILAAIQGIYRWTDARFAATAEKEGAATALLEGYLEKGADILEAINGRFSLALIDEGKNEVFIATDRIASEPVIYAQTGRTVAFASTPDVLRNHPAFVCDIDPQAIFNYLYFHVVPGPGGIYKGHKKLLPGTCARFSGGEPVLSVYWTIDFRENSASASFTDLKEEFLSILQSSVKSCVATGKTGAFLSGGTDSTTITGILSGIQSEPVHTYSIGFAAEGYDEMEYARIAAERFHTHHHEYYVTPDDIVDAVPKIAEIYGEPFGNSSAVPAYYCARLAKNDDVTRMLGGDGGDELFAGNPHYARQYLFSIYDAIPGLMRKRVIEPFVNSSLYPNITFPLRKLRSYVEQASVPMPARLQTYNLLWRLGIQNVIEPEFLGQIDLGNPEELMSRQYESAHADTMLNKMLWLDYKFILADNDLPKVSRMCELAGLQVAYPLLSEELVTFAARLPPGLKLKRDKLRFFFKEALQELLPVEIIQKQKHGFGLPVGLWVASHEGFGELARDNLNDLKSRGIVKAGLIDNLLDTRLGEHASYYGTMVWILMMLEQWFKKHHSGG